METCNFAPRKLGVFGRQPLPVIFAIDNDEDSLVLLSYVVEELPCLFFCETSGEAGLERIIDLKPDLVLLDICLPGFSGLDVIDRLKSSLDTALIPIVAVTALAGQQNQRRLLTAGCDHYICKPYELSNLQAAIRQYLQTG
jgi:CheY-like chemotaxis protein